jgi:hypothetical protein
MLYEGSIFALPKAEDPFDLFNTFDEGLNLWHFVIILKPIFFNESLESERRPIER